MIARSPSRLLLLMGLALLYAQQVRAQVSVPGLDSVVLVLKLVSKTHVQPTTGLVVSDAGLIVVSAGFIAAGDEIVVLDGGTDISRYGRPATVVKHTDSGELVVLAVEGLDRPGIKLLQTDSGHELQRASALHLAAFPPAAGIAAGEQPLWMPVTVTEQAANGKFSVSAETPLPNVTGAIIDQCGLLYGLNLARGTQSLDSGKRPTTIFAAELVRVLDSVEISLTSASCKMPAQGQVAAIPDAEGPQEANSMAKPEMNGETNPEGEERPTEAVAGEKTDSVPGLDPSARVLENTIGSSNTGDGTSPSTSIWTQLLFLLALAAIGMAGLKILSRRTRPARQSRAPNDEGYRSVDSEEPDTAVLQLVEDSPLLSSAANHNEANELPDMDTLPAGHDSFILLEGVVKNIPFRRFCVVNSEKIDLVIGRADTDLNLESPAISRRHAHLEGRKDALTLSDLGSSNGSFVRGIPCLSGEIMFIDPADEIQLGNLRLRIKVVTNRIAGP